MTFLAVSKTKAFSGIASLLLFLSLPIEVGLSAANGSVTYTYDSLGRIATASYDTGVFIIYSYDANGNRLSQTVNVNTTTLQWAPASSPCTSNCWGSTLWH